MAFPGLEFSFLAKFFKFFKRLSLFEEIIIPGFQEEGEILEPASKGKSSRSRKKAEPSGSTKIFWASFWGSKWGIKKSQNQVTTLRFPSASRKPTPPKPQSLQPAAHNPTAHNPFTYKPPYRPPNPVRAPKTPYRPQNPIQAPKPHSGLQASKSPMPKRPLQIKKSLIRLRWCPSLRKSPRRKSPRQEISRQEISPLRKSQSLLKIPTQ